MNLIIQRGDDKNGIVAHVQTVTTALIGKVLELSM